MTLYQRLVEYAVLFILLLGSFSLMLSSFSDHSVKKARACESKNGLYVRVYNDKYRCIRAFRMLD